MRNIISCSRRTDIPAFYMDWLIESIKSEKVQIVNPYTKKIFVKSLNKEHIAGFVFWSKNFNPLINNFKKLKNYNKYFQFTINDHNTNLEKNLKLTSQNRIEQVKKLADLNGSNSIMWRYDPIVHWYDKNGIIHNNFKNFDLIAENMYKLNIKNLTISFMDIYKKSIKRAKKYNIDFFNPPIEEKTKIIQHIIKVCKSLNINVHTCCNTELEAYPEIKKAKCINGELLSKLWNEKLSKAQDSAQRKNNGCGCTKSIDIGSYDKHKCYHNCIYCYAQNDI